MFYIADSWFSTTHAMGATELNIEKANETEYCRLKINWNDLLDFILFLKCMCNSYIKFWISVKISQADLWINIFKGYKMHQNMLSNMSSMRIYI